jgi:hypothetical protein
MQTIFPFYQDPGHAWLKVPMKLLKELEIEKKISQFSYWRKGFAYLEEDRDLLLFIQAMKEKKQFTFGEGNIRSFHTDRSSKIRGYEFYRKEIA